MFPWSAFLPYILVVAVTPGPNNIMSMNNAAQKGFRKALPFNFGILAGLFAVMLLCTVFSGLLFTLIPQIELPMKIAGAAYMLYLALKILLPSKKRNPRNSNGSFFSGAVLQFINPKIIFYGITAISTYVLPRYVNIPKYSKIPVLVGFAFLLVVTAFGSTLCWSAFGSLFNRIFDEHGRALGVIMAVLLMYCAISLFL